MNKNAFSIDSSTADAGTLLAGSSDDDSWQTQLQSVGSSLTQAADLLLSVPAVAQGHAGAVEASSKAGEDLAGTRNATGTGISSALALPTDPKLAQQWHLSNPTAGLLDLNVFGVWNPAQGTAYTGAGIRTVVIDDGFDYLHSDLAPNYDTGLDYDFAELDLDPFGASSDAHGTAVTGIIGADNNGGGTVGVAFDTSLVGYRVYGFISDEWLVDIRESIHHSAVSAQADVVNISQGIANDTASEFGVGYNAARFDEIEASIGTAVGSGRGGLGTIIMKSAGNSRSANYDVNADDWSNDTRQVVVAAVDQNGFVSSYSSYGAAILVSGFGTPGQVVTTDRTGAAGYNSTDFTSGFNGTSAAAPMVTGVAALMLDANAALGWRDVQTILASSARQVGSEVGAGIAGSERFAWGWNASSTWNGGGMHFSNDYGHGLVDALAAVRMAETWLLTGTSAATNVNQFTNTMDVLNSSTIIPDANTTGLSFAGSAAFDDLVERVTVTMTFSTTFTGDLDVFLTSPDGTVSQLIADTGGSNDFNGTWTFESQAFRGERAAGTWTVRVADDAAGDVLTVSDIVIRTYGAFTSDDRYVFTNEYSDYDGVSGHATAVSDSNGGADTVNAAAVSSASVIRLDGAAGSIDGVAVTFANIEHAIGGDGGDSIVGSGVGNMLFGMRGNDTLDGGSGDDTLRGGDGDDRIVDTLLIENGADVYDGGSGVDTLVANLTWVSTVTFDLTAGWSSWNGTNYDSLLNIENLTLGGAASAIGSAAANVITYIDSGGLNNSVEGRGGDDSISTGGGNDTLDGGDGTDTLLGGDGDDVLIQNFGGPNEIMNGGNGNDTGDWSYSVGDSWVIDLVAGTADIGGTSFALLTSIENVVGGQLADSIVGSAGANSLVGSAGNDTLDGGEETDTLRGGEGDDVLIQNFGGPDEIMDGGNGNDTGDWSYSGNSWIIDLTTGTADIGATTWALLTSIENVVGAQGSDSIVGDAGGNNLRGEAGNDTLVGGDGADSLFGGGGDDIYIVNLTAAGGLEDVFSEAGGSGTDNLRLEGASTNVVAVTVGLAATLENLNATATGTSLLNLVGNASANIIRGNSANNILTGAGGADSVFGSAGDDTYVVNLTAAGALEDVVSEAGGSGIDTLKLDGTSSNVAAVTLTLAAGLENLNAQNTGTSLLNLAGNAAANTIRGNGAANILTGADGADTLSGFAGDDIYVVNLTAAGALEDTVSEGGGSGNDTLKLEGNSTNVAPVTLILAAGLENLNAQNTGTSLLNLTGNAAGNVIRGNGADNILTGAAGVDSLSGFAGDDIYVVNLTAAGGLEDVVSEGGGSGVDTLKLEGTSTNPGAVTLTLAAGLENLNAQNTGTSLLNLTGNAAANAIRGNGADNILIGEDGADTLSGFAGDDTYVVNLTAAGGLEDTVSEAGGSGDDTLKLEGTSTNVVAVTLTLAAGLENLNAQTTGTSLLDLTGNSVANVVKANAADNVIIGLGGDDTLSGFGGADTLVGGGGGDSLAGGAGNDTFDFDGLGEMGLTDTTWDVITDFTNTDTIDLATLDANTATVIDDAFDSLVVGGTFSGSFASAGDLYFDNVANVLWGNTDADAAAEFAIELVGVLTLTTAEFVL